MRNRVLKRNNSIVYIPNTCKPVKEKRESVLCNEYQRGVYIDENKVNKDQLNGYDDYKENVVDGHWYTYDPAIPTHYYPHPR